ncbi:MAG: hypothetical protein V8R52_10640 [Coprobacter fastidiosus]
MVIEITGVTSVKATQKGKKLPEQLLRIEFALILCPEYSPVKIRWKK